MYKRFRLLYKITFRTLHTAKAGTAPLGALHPSLRSRGDPRRSGSWSRTRGGGRTGRKRAEISSIDIRYCLTVAIQIQTS